METEGKLFTPNPERTFTKKVTFKLPTESGNETVVTVPVTFKSLPKSELKQMQEDLDDDSVYEKVVTGVDGVGDGEGGKLDPAKAKVAMAEESSFVYEALVEYYNVMMGGNLKAKTSKKRRSTG